MLIASAIYLGGCSPVILGLHPPDWIHGTWVVVVETGGQSMEMDMGFEFTATTAHVFMPQVRLDLSEMYRRAGSGGEVITDALYSFTIRAQAGAFGYSEGDYVTYEFRRVTNARVDWFMKAPLGELGPFTLHKR
ncbi:MAG: hypothetical protein PHZ21_04045 [Candidatus Bipolaricaulis sp.]|nr:hypothetical protein [Candidatus Bipolaricaulis sp.]